MKAMQKWTAVLLCIALSAGILVGCQPSGEEKSSSGAASGIVSEENQEGTSMQGTTSGSTVSGGAGSQSKPAEATTEVTTKLPSGSMVTIPVPVSKPASTASTGSNTQSTAGSSSSVAPSNPERAYYQNIRDTELAFLASMQVDNGALPMTAVKNGNATMNPYFADFAAQALLDAGTKYQAQVKKYANWHFSHLNTASTDYNKVDGTIYDYTLTISNGKVTNEKININADNKKSYDSTDSYAATFLCVLWKYVQKTGDKSYVLSHYNEVGRIVNAMVSTMDNDLTYAKPDYRVQYLMDNCEVYEGLLAAANLYANVFGSKSGASAKATSLRNQASKVKNAIESRMWRSSGAHYEAAVDRSGNAVYTFAWGEFYPSATAQLFPISSGLISPTSSRAKQLYKDFNANFSNGTSQHNWEKIDIPDSFYWGSIPYTAVMMGDMTRVKSYMKMYEKAMKRHAYPLYNADIAKVAMAANLAMSKV